MVTRNGGKLVIFNDLPLLGSRWAARPNMPAERYSCAGVVFKNKMWFIGGYSATKEVYSSSDGYAWTREPDFPETIYGHTAIVYDNKIWVIGGTTTSAENSKKVYYSSDGKTWKEAGTNSFTGGVRLHTSFVFDNKMWVVAGLTPDGLSKKCMYSTDGSTWAEAGTDTYPIAVRGLGSVVKGNTAYCIGGYDGSYCSNVYSTTDCINWTKCADVPREAHRPGVVLYNDTIYVVGSQYPAGESPKVFYTDDASVWTEAGTDALTYGVWGGVTLNFNNRIWQLAGYMGYGITDRVKCTW